VRIDCHVPITLRIVGVPTDDQLAAVGAALARAVAARLAEAERLLADRHGHRGGTDAEVRERYDPARQGVAGYAVASYGNDGDLVEAPDGESTAAPAAAAPTASGSAPPPKKKERSVPADLRKRARTDPEAAHELIQRYRRMSEAELRRRARNGDETARAVLRQSIPSNEEARARAEGSDYRPPHSATVSVRRGTREIWSRQLTSGKPTAEELALGYPAWSLATHTEARAARNAPLQPGDVMIIMGQYDPCGSCQRAMQEAANRTGATIWYFWMGGKLPFRPASKPGTPGGSAEPSGGGRPEPETAPTTRETAPAEPAPGPAERSPAEESVPGGPIPIRPAPSRPATAAGRPARVSVVAGVASAGLAITAINDFLSLINAAGNQAQENIDLGEAEVAFWTWLGALRTVGVWDSRYGAQPPGSPVRAGAWSSSSYRYVVDIDVAALRQNLPGRIHSYQDFLYFVDAARQLGAIEEDPPQADHPDAVQRAQATHVRYYATVSKVDRAKRHRYDLTDIIAPVRDAALAQLDATMRQQAGALNADRRHQVFRLRHGADTPIYRAAHKETPLHLIEQQILNSQLLFGPDPWVRVVGPDTDVGLIGKQFRVRVTPANADAERVSLASSYWVGGDIYDAFEEVTKHGRPILDRQPADGRIIDSFLAGPMPGNTRFGNTRYYRHPDGAVGRTAAIGELYEFWVERDDLEPIPTAEVERYATAIPPTR
jgi:hypothetical protein